MAKVDGFSKEILGGNYERRVVIVDDLVDNPALYFPNGTIVYARARGGFFGVSGNAFVPSALGGTASDWPLVAWTEAGAYEATSVTRDSDGVPTSAVLKWPDSSAGAFTLVTKNTTWLAVDAYTVSHADSGKTVTQAAVTRDANGNITTKPALTVA